MGYAGRRTATPAASVQAIPLRSFGRGFISHRIIAHADGVTDERCNTQVMRLCLVAVVHFNDGVGDLKQQHGAGDATVVVDPGAMDETERVPGLRGPGAERRYWR